MQTPYGAIKTMVTDYSNQMSAINAALRQNPSGPQLNTKSPLGFYLKPEELEAAQKTISNQPGFRQYLAIFGVEDESGYFTVCLVGADADGNILDVYKKDNSIAVEERWPGKTSLTLSSSADDVSKFLS
jgi:hypothetical protein